MKEVYIIRHGKSSHDIPGLSDHDRALAARGESDSELMGKHIAELFPPDQKKNIVFVSSSALRARSTADIFMKAYFSGTGRNFRIIIEEDLYLAEDSEIERIVKKYLPDYDNLFFFGHNPGMSDYTNNIYRKYSADLPTTGVFRYSCTAGRLKNEWIMVEESCVVFMPSELKSH